MTRVWFITGASGGFGRSSARHALEQGEIVVGLARDPAVLSDLIDHAARFGGEFLPLAGDITQPDELQTGVAEAVNRYGRIDIVLHAAGQGAMGGFEELDDAATRAVFEVNVFGTINLCRAVLPTLRAQRGGHLLLLTAIVATANHAAFAAYGASKFALDGFGEALAEELAPLGVRVTMILPGPFRTPFLDRSMTRAESTIDDYTATAGKYRHMIERINGRQPGNPDKAAAAIDAVTRAERPPLRLFLGKYAHDTIKKKLQRMADELAAWQDVGLPTDGWE